MERRQEHTIPSELDSLNQMLADPVLTDLLFNGHKEVFVEREGKLERAASPFQNEEAFEELLTLLTALPNTIRIGRLQSDGMLPDGSRFHITQPPQSPSFPTLSVRKFMPTVRALESLVGVGTLSKKAAQFLTACVHGRLNILISGPSSVGKTTLLSALCSKVDVTERIITIEDVPEIHLKHRNWVRLVSVPERGGSLRDCLVGALRMRPDRIVIGECRSFEALEMLQAMNTGHDGSMTTLHANSTKDALTRLETLILFHSGVEIPLRSLRRHIVDALHVVVHLKRHRDGRRQVEEILGLESMEGEVITRSSLFMRENPKDGSRLVSTGLVPKFIERFKERDIVLPQNFFDPAYEE